ncbi:MAG: flagellar export protein FliJ [Gemmatimonas sp.]|jgi:flagellar FliJ protein|uniref:flagellar export protein FliJ n=1 Tax=Gemmatimonas sp. TaxID=1962908 RepID=UPI00391EE6DB|nr:flagellar export protein FliJ [Gemmatimonadota bacterium]
MAFNFRLQRILELRAQHEQVKARELAAARERAETAARARDALAAVRDESHTQLHTATQRAPRVGHLHQLGTVLASLDERLVVASDVVKHADAGVQEARALLDSAARDRRVLDRLKERHAHAWRTDEAQKDRVQMDEVALAKYTRTQDTKDARDGEPAGRDSHRDGSPR